MIDEKPWRYSHTQLDLWKLCKRRWFHRYVLNQREPKTDNMAAGTWLAQEPIEIWIEQGDAPYMSSLGWESVWANFLAEFEGDDSYDSPIFTLDLAKRILKAYQANPVQGRVVEVERTYEIDLGGGLVYTTRPDLVVDRVIGDNMMIQRVAWDIKLKTFNQSRAGDTFFAKADLLPWDDQGLGQAIGAGADTFGQIQFFVGKKDGMVIGPVYMEQQVNPVLVEEWRRETTHECKQIETLRRWAGVDQLPWPKHQQGCHAFGHACPNLAACGFGFVGVDNQLRKEYDDDHANSQSIPR